MVRNGEFTPKDAKRVLRKYWWVLLVSTVTMGMLGTAATYVLPKKYTSSTMVLVEPPEVPRDVVAPIVQTDLYHDLASMKEQIFSRSALVPIIVKYNLYPEARKTQNQDMDGLVEQLKKAIDVELIQPLQGSSSKQPPGFQVSVTFRDPQIAKQICTDITLNFVERKTHRDADVADNTTKFLTEQLNEAKAKLDAEDAKLAEFQRQHLGSLPDQEQANLNLLTGMNTQLEVITQSISRAQQDKIATESALNTQETLWKATATGQQNPETQEQQLSALQDQLAILMSKYTPEHPDVIKLKAQIEDLQKKLAAEPAPKSTAAQASNHEPPVIQQLRTQVKLDDMKIAELAKRQTQIQDQIRGLQGRIESSPMVEQQIKELTRNHQAALDFYNDLAKKTETSEMGGKLTHQQQSETFRVLDPPSAPQTPSFPNKLYFMGGGFGGGLFLGLAILGLIAYSDKSLHTERDVETTLKLPVLALIPTLDPAVSNSKANGMAKVA